MHHTSLIPALVAGGSLIAALAACGGPAPQPDFAKPPPPPVASSPAPADTASAAPLDSAPAPLPEPAPSATAPAAPPPLPGFAPIPAEAKGKYPGTTIAKARMFDLSGACPEPIGADGRLCSAAAQPGVELTKVQIERTILLLTDQRAFGGAAASCFTPDHAMVFYDDKDLPIAWTSLSLSCSSLQARPQLQGIKGHEGIYHVSSAAIGFLRGVCKTHKLAACEPSKK